MEKKHVLHKKWAIPIAVVLGLAVVCVFVLLCVGYSQWMFGKVALHIYDSYHLDEMDYETCDVADYGHYVGNSETFMTEYIRSFFPEEISEDFQDVSYVFHSRKIDAHGFEAYLEFTIADHQKFLDHVTASTRGMQSQTFRYDENYQEYVITEDEWFYDMLSLGDYDEGDEDTEAHYSIQHARIGKILVNHNEQRVIYVALAVYDGGGSDTALLDAYFDRFNIPLEDYDAYSQQFYK